MLKESSRYAGGKKEAEALQIKTSDDRMNVATNRRQKSKEDSKNE